MSSRAFEENNPVLDPSGTASTPPAASAFESRRARREREAQDALAHAHSAGVPALADESMSAAPANTEFLSRRERRRVAQQKTAGSAEDALNTPAQTEQPPLTRRSRRRAAPQVADAPDADDAVVLETADDVLQSTGDIESAEAEVVEAETEAEAGAKPVVELEPEAVPTTTESFEEIIAGAFPIDESSVADDAAGDNETDEVPAAAATDAPRETPVPRRGRHGVSESAPVDAPRSPRSIRRLAAKTMSVSALLAVGLMTVATSVPANALLSADEVQAQKRQSLVQESSDSGSAQSMVNTASADLSMHRDTYGALTAAKTAAELGINPEDSFTNDPNGTVQWPFAVGVHIGSGYGPRPGCSIGCSTNHMGQDFNPGYGAPIQSIADGVVVESTNAGGGFGVKIVIEHVIDGQMIHSLYGHMIPGSRTVQVGDHVSVGQVIGKTGNTGISTGAHLHFEILINGTRHVDPLTWLYENTN